jgi:hypothetical protein
MPTFAGSRLRGLEEELDPTCRPRLTPILFLPFFFSTCAGSASARPPVERPRSAWRARHGAMQHEQMVVRSMLTTFRFLVVT